MKKNILNTTFVLLALLLLILSNASIAEPAGCAAGTTPEFEEIKKLIHKVRDAGAISKSVKKDLIARYEKTIAMDKSIINGTHPICVDLINYDKELTDYEHKVSLFDAEVGDYTNQCTGTISSEEQYNTCVTWRSNLLTRETQLNNWKTKLDQILDPLNKRVNNLNEQNKNFDIQLLADMEKALDTPIEIVVKRTSKPSSGGCTLGEFWVNGEFFCHTLELPFNNNNNNFSSIAVGRYDAFVGPTNKRPNGVIQLKNVQSVIYYNDNGNWRIGHINRNAGGKVLIHGGTKPKHTKGCILIADTIPDKNKCVLRNIGDSALKRLYKKYFGDETKPDPSKKVSVTIKTAYE